MYCGPWGRRELDITERLNNNKNTCICNWKKRKKVHIISFQLHIYVYLSAYIFTLTYPHSVSICVYIFSSLIWKFCTQTYRLFYFTTIIFSAQQFVFIWGILEWLCQILSHRETEVAFWQFGGKGASEAKQIKPLHNHSQDNSKIWWQFIWLSKKAAFLTFPVVCSTPGFRFYMCSWDIFLWSLIITLISPCWVYLCDVK